MIDAKKYPEHAKLEAVADKTQFVHDFLTFCEENGAWLMSEGGAYKNHRDLLFKFTGIDQWKLEDEKRAMIDEFRKETKKL